MEFNVEDATIYLATHGSHAYGTNIETSDVDVKGVCVPPLSYFLGYAYRFDQQEKKSPDQVIYGVQKFFKLAADCNPNIIEVLFVDEKHIRKITPAGQLMREHRDLFLSKKARHTFAGYAHAQLKRIKGHRAWLDNPPKGKPERADFGLPEHRIVGKQQLGVISALTDAGYEFSEEAERILTREKQYALALAQYKQYENWKATRNAARAELEAKFGYDTKHAMHLIRLMRMCVEILNGQGVKVFRPDALELIDIRYGRWSYDRVIEEAEMLEQKAALLYEETAHIPHHPDPYKLNVLCMNVVNRHLDLVPGGFF